MLHTVSCTVWFTNPTICLTTPFSSKTKSPTPSSSSVRLPTSPLVRALIRSTRVTSPSTGVVTMRSTSWQTSCRIGDCATFVERSAWMSTVASCSASSTLSTTWSAIVETVEVIPLRIWFTIASVSSSVFSGRLLRSPPTSAARSTRTSPVSRSNDTAPSPYSSVRIELTSF